MLHQRSDIAGRDIAVSVNRLVAERKKAPMAVGESPAVARHRLRLALKEARDRKGLTQRQVANALEWSMAKVNRIEAGDVTISATDLQALLRLLDVTDLGLVQRLLDQARTSRRRGWWDQSNFRDHLTSANIQSIQFEQDASAIRSFQPKVIPGNLQTQDYAQALLSSPWSTHLSEADITARIEARTRRREELLTRASPADYLLVLDESVLLREVGGPKVLSNQLYDLLQLAGEGRIMVRVLPFSHPGSYAAFGLFTIFDSKDHGVALVYRESYEADEALMAPENVQRHRSLFERIWEQSLGPEASTRLIEARAATMRSAADRLVPDG